MGWAGYRRNMSNRRILSFKQRLRQIQQSLSIYRYCGRAIALVWITHRPLTLALAALTLVAGLLPGLVAYLGKLIVDAVVVAAQSGLLSDRWLALQYLGLEAIAVALLAGSKQGIALCQSLLRMQLGQKVNVLILDIAHFEDSEFYDKMIRARREASSRPLSLVGRTFGLVQDSLALITYGGLLLKFSPGAVGILILAAIPAFVAETRFAGEAFRLFQWRAPGENIGAGDVHHIEDESRWQDASAKGTADTFITTLPETYHTRLGHWFRSGRELSGGQWQKIALSRAFMRQHASILVLDEPTSAMDAEAEMQIFHQFRAMTQNQMAILISHRFSTVRMADHILVLERGKVVEQGNHQELLAQQGRYAYLFSIQAGYR